MWRLVVAQVLRRRGRSLAVVAAIVTAAVSFSLLTSAVATSRLQVQGTVKANFRTAYDILVRPAGSATPLERQQRLVQANYLSGIYGGITLAQYHQIQHLPGVQVAAPVAMVGYFLPSLFLQTKITGLVTGERQQLYRLRTTWVTDRGLTRVPGPDKYLYVSDQRFRYDQQGQSQLDPVTGKRIAVCGGLGSGFSGNLGTPARPFDRRRMTELTCHSTTTSHEIRGDGFRPGEIGTGLQYPFPLLLAAIDPVAEAKLVGLDDAMVSGRYLQPGDRTTTITTSGGSYGKIRHHSVPVLMANRPLSDDSVRIKVQRLAVGDPRRLPGRLAARHAYRWVNALRGRVLRTTSMSDAGAYPQLLAGYGRRLYNAKTQYWSAGQVSYHRSADGHLVPVRQRNRPTTWLEPLYGGFYAPWPAADTGFRRLHVHIGSNAGSGHMEFAPILHRVGTFDPAGIAGFSELSRVPLTTYYPPDAAPGDARSAGLLGGRSLLPNSNLAGYLQQPPMMLTTIRSLGSFSDPQAFTGTGGLGRAPISVIRVRVAGVSGPDPVSRERVRLVAEQIARSTGLDVDVTIGSSPTPQLVDLPAGEFGRPGLVLSEGWVQKGAAVRLLSAVDAKSLALFVLVLVVCLLFLLNATIAAVRTRRTELGVLACLGWPAGRIFALLEVELLATGAAAGLVGTGLAAVLTAVLSLHTAWWQLVVITPVATGLAGLAGVGPAWRACHAAPIEAITVAVRAPRRAHKVTSLTGLAVVGVTRWPGRTVLGAVSLFIGTAALAILIAIQTAFQGGVAGTLLGDVVAVQVRGVDYLAAGLTIGLGAFAVADVAYLNIAERVAEIGTFRASGWDESHLRRLFGTEALLTAALGAVTGAAVGVGVVAVLFPVGWASVLTAAGVAAGAGLLAALAALAVPLARLSRLAPATAITTE